MNKSESIIEITKAICSVMSEIDGVEKNLTVGEGKTAYKGVADKDVKKIILPLMSKNGLVITPKDIEENTEVTRWVEEGQYGKKQKQSVFVRVKVTYLLSHISGEWIEITGIGHGVDSQDKAAGKATTYALKYALLYTFLIPTGKIDDADETHSDQIETPEAKESKQEDNKPWMNEIIYKKCIDRINGGEQGIYANADKTYRMKKEYRAGLKDAEAKPKNQEAK